MRGRGVLLAVCCAVLAQVGLADLSAPAGAAPSAVVRASGPAAERAAAAQARSSGRRVEVLSRRSETEQVYANPDGTFTATVASAPVRVQRPDGSWALVDTTLRRTADGSVAPVATPVDLRLSGGGTAALISLSHAGKAVTLTWPAVLPAPTLAGDTASYADVLPGVDLRVRATVTGFSHVLVVRTAAAAANPALARIRFGLRTAGVTARIGPAGELSAVDSAGRPVFTAPPARMWDSTTTANTAAGRRTGVAAVSTERAPGAEARRSALAIRLGVGTMELVPDRRLLSAGRFPVFLDPEWTANLGSWTEVNAYTAGSVWRTADTLPAAGHAYDNFGTYTVRSFFAFSTSAVSHAHIFDATMRAFLIHSWSCQPRPVELWMMPSAADSASTWNSQPSWSSAQWQSTQNVAKGYSGCAAGTVGFDTTRGVARAAAAGGGSITLGLKAANENDVFGWKKFDVTNPQTIPQLDINYDFAPNPLAAKDLSTKGPDTSCAAVAASAPRINVPTTGMTLRARATDPDGTQNKLRVNFEWVNSGGTRVGGVTSTQAFPGSTFTVTLPRSTLPADGNYAWHANVQDINPETGAVMTTTAWSPWCRFTLDTTKPNAPAITSPEYPDGDPVDDQRTGLGRAAHFTFGANGSTDVVKYIWSLNQDRSLAGTVVTVPAGGSADISLTPDRPGLAKLYVLSVDAAGNHQAASVAWEFTVPWTTFQPAAVYHFDGDLTDASSFDAHIVGSGAEPTFVPGRTGQAVHLEQTLLGTDHSTVFSPYHNFAISVWVRLASTAATATAVSISGVGRSDGVPTPAFELGYDVSSGRWQANMFGSGPPARSAMPAVAGRWTLLTVTYELGPERLRLFVDGQLTGDSTSSPSSAIIGDGAYLGIGATMRLGHYWAGDIDEVQVWNRLAYPSEIALIGEWGLDGTGRDDSPAGRDVVTGADVSYGPDRWGLPAQAMTVTGTANGYAATAGPVLQTNASYSVSVWVLLGGKSTTGIAVCQFGSRATPFSLQYRADLDRWTVDLLAADADTTTLIRLQSTASPPTGVWTQLLFVYDGAAHKARLYVGTTASVPVLQQEASYTAGWNATGPLNIGRLKIRGAASNFWNGGLDDVTVYGDALTDYEISQLS